MSQIEETTIKDYSTREQALHEARQRLKTIREDMEQIGAKLSFPKFHMIHRDSSVTDGGLYPGYMAHDDKRGEKKQTTIESVYTQLAIMIGESDPILIVERFLQQRTHALELLGQEDAAKSAVRKAKLRKRFLLDKLSQLQYSGGLKREKLNVRSTRINEAMSTTMARRDKLNKWLEDHSQLMDEMLVKLKEICTINDFKLPPLSSEVPAENVATCLKFVLKQLERLLGSGFEGSFTFSPMPTHSTGLDDLGTGGLLPFEITAEGPSIFNLPSPVGSTTSFRLGGSLSDIEGGGGTHELSASDLLASFRDRAPSIIVHGEDEDHGMQLLDVTHRGGAEIKVKGVGGGGRRDSSEEEEAVTRNFVKRQSQILFEAKTRKGRFQGGSGSGSGPAGSPVGGGGRKY